MHLRGIEVLESENRTTYKDITQLWKNSLAVNEPCVIDASEVIINNIHYVIDGHSIILDYSCRERIIGELLSKATGKTVIMQPRVSGHLRNQKWPDYLINNARWDLKIINDGKSSSLLRNIVHKKNKQADNFIFDITNSVLPESEIIRQAQQLYSHYNTQNVDHVVLIRKHEIIRVFVRIR